MNRRNFLLNLLFSTLSFGFGYKVGNFNTKSGNDLKEELEQRSINVTSFGADESLTDNSRSFSNAINHIKNILGGKGKLILPAGKTFKFTQPIGEFNLSNIEIDLNGCTLDFSDLPVGVGYAYLAFRGTYDDVQLLTDNTVIGDKTIKVANTSSFSAGDMIRIFSNKIFDSSRTRSKIGEIVYIESIDSATQLTLKTSINFDYVTKKRASIQRLSPVENIYIYNGTIIGPNKYNEHYAIELQVARNCLISNMKTLRVDKRHYVFTDCINVNIKDSFLKRAVHTTQGYGVSFVDSTRDCTCSNCHFDGLRHSLSTNNNFSTSWGIPRRISFLNNTVENSPQNLTDGNGGDAIDTHAAAEEIRIIGNTVYGSSGHGINFEARSGIIANNSIEDTETIGIYVNPRSDFKSRILVTGNQLKRIGKVTSNNYGICYVLETAGCEQATITNNQVDSQQQAIRARGTTTYQFDKLVIQGNEGEVTVSGHGCHVEYAKNSIINGNSIKAPDIGIYANEITNTSITGNSILLSGTGSSARGIQLSGDTAYTTVNGNMLKDEGVGRATAFGVMFQSTVTYSGALNNITQGFSTNINISTGTGNISGNNI